MSSRISFPAISGHPVKFRSAIIGLLILITSCQDECPPRKRIADRANLHDAWSSWMESLDYMDEDVVLKSYDFLKCTIDEARKCKEIKMDVTTGIDSVTIWYLSPNPTSDQMLKAAQWKEQIRVALH